MELFHTARPWLHSWPQWRRWIVGARCVRRIQTSIIADQSKCIHGGELYKYRPDLTKIWRHTNFHNKSIGISFTDSTFGLSCILLAFAFMLFYVLIYPYSVQCIVYRTCQFRAKFLPSLPRFFGSNWFFESQRISRLSPLFYVGWNPVVESSWVRSGLRSLGNVSVLCHECGGSV